MTMLKSTLLLAVGLLSAAAADPAIELRSDNAPAAFPAVPPKGHLIMWGADATRAGTPSTYQISYLADEAVAGKPLQMVVKRAIQIEKEELNKQTGKMDRKKIDQFTFSFLPITPKKQAVEMIELPKFEAKEYKIEVFFAAEGTDKAEPLSNSLGLSRKGELYLLPEAEEAVKVGEALPATATVKPQKPRKVLVYTRCLGYAHDAIPLGARTILMMGDRTGAWQTLISNDRSMFEPETLAQFDAVMMMDTTGSLFGDKDKTVNERLRTSLLDFVEGGKGIAGSHAATDCSKEWKEYGAMMGGYFAGHPFKFDKSTAKVRNEDPAHPLNAAFKGEGFTVQDEFYTMMSEPYSREKLHILLSLDLSTLADDPARPGFKLGENRTDHDYPMSWLHDYGKGRAFYCAFGHHHQIFWTPALLRHYLDGMQYALGDLKADATPTAKLAH